MGVMQLLEGRFFTEAEPGGEPRAGDIYWAPTPELEREPRILEINRAGHKNTARGSFASSP